MSHILLTAHKGKVSPAEHDISFGIVKKQWEDVGHITQSAKHIAAFSLLQLLLFVCYLLYLFSTCTEPRVAECAWCLCVTFCWCFRPLQVSPHIICFQALMAEFQDSSNSHSTVYQPLFFVLSINLCGNSPTMILYNTQYTTYYTILYYMQNNVPKSNPKWIIWIKWVSSSVPLLHSWLSTQLPHHLSLWNLSKFA